MDASSVPGWLGPGREKGQTGCWRVPEALPELFAALSKIVHSVIYYILFKYYMQQLYHYTCVYIYMSSYICHCAGDSLFRRHIQWSNCDKSVDPLFHILVQTNPTMMIPPYLSLAANLELDTVPLEGFDLDEGRVVLFSWKHGECEESWHMTRLHFHMYWLYRYWYMLCIFLSPSISNQVHVRII